MSSASEITIVERSDLAYKDTDISVFKDMSFEAIAQSGMVEVVQGYDVVSGKENIDLMKSLEGVPFLIVGVSFFEGAALKVDSKTLLQQDYVSLRILMGDEAYMRKRGIDPDTLPLQIRPSNTVILNDGSTGIRRQIVEYLVKQKYISLPEPIIAGGGKGESTFDLCCNDWAGIHYGKVAKRIEDDRDFYTADLPRPILCPRGVRSSEYDNPVNPNEKAFTFYLA